MPTQIITTNQPGHALEEVISGMSPDKVIVLSDRNTQHACVPVLVDGCNCLKNAPHVSIDAGDDNKNIDSAQKIWSFLCENGATRSSLLINVGGGMITDIGGFTASSFKRGIKFINVPTTLLGAVDAAVGGKTGINFCGLKNEIGFFSLPEAVVITTQFLDTLPESQLVSGYAEMVKMAYVFAPDLIPEMINSNPVEMPREELLRLMSFCVEKKNEITMADLREAGLRKLLNFGHTAGHAFESLSYQRSRPISHGEAVAHGMLYALIISCIAEGMPSDVIYPYIDFLHHNYESLPFGCNDIDDIIDLMGHDKKNKSSRHPSFVLLRNPGEPVCDCCPSREQLVTGFEIFNDIR